MHAHAHSIVAAESGRHSAMSRMPNLLGWWELDRGGTIVAIDDTQNAWNTFTSYFATGVMDPSVTDPVGGTSAGKITESGSSQSQYVYKSAPLGSNLANGPLWRECWQRANTTDYGGIGEKELAPNWGAFNLAAGTVVATPTGGGAWVLESNGLWRRNRIYMPAMAAGADDCLAGCSNAAGAWSYAGSGKSIYVYGLRTRQDRCSALSDAAPLSSPAKTVKYDFSQSTPASQLFVQRRIAADSIGGNLWKSRSAVWNPRDTAATMACTVASLRTALASSWTFVADINILAAPTANGVLFGGAGTREFSLGISTGSSLYVTCFGSSVVTAALATGRHQIAVEHDAATHAWTLYVDGTLATGPTVTYSPTGLSSVSIGARRIGVRAAGLSGNLLTLSQVGAECAALLAEAA